MGNADKLFWNNGVPAAPLEGAFTPDSALVVAYRPKQLETRGGPQAENLEKKPEECIEKGQKGRGIKKMIKRAVGGLKTWLTNHSCCRRQDEGEGPMIRVVDTGDFEAGRGIVWIDQSAGRNQGFSGEEKGGSRNSAHGKAIVTVEEVCGP